MFEPTDLEHLKLHVAISARKAGQDYHLGNGLLLRSQSSTKMVFEAMEPSMQNRVGAH